MDDEVDFKISAVFSLVGDSNDGNASPPNLLEVSGDANSSTDTATSDEEPPTLTSEVDSNADDVDLRVDDKDSPSCIHAIPPILQLEEETVKQMLSTSPKHQVEEMPWLMKDKMSPTSRLRKRIAPSYIVLKSVERFLAGKTSISYRKFKRVFSDCTNMCKKMYFVRRLKSGKDVFNVKTPSKQKDYYLYLEDKKIGNFRKNKPAGMRSLKSILNTKRFSISERNTSNENHMKRVRRMVTTLPKDFHSLLSIMNRHDLGLEDDDVVDDEERLKRQTRLKSMKQHALDALVLSKQIEIKRSHNKTMKKLKSKSKSNSEARSITKEGVTSSVSGRVCKPNQKYLDGFAVNMSEIHEQMCVEKTNNRLKKLTNDANMVKQKRQNEDGPHTSANKKPKPVICIDNPEMESETCIKSSTGNMKRPKKSTIKRRPILKEANSDLNKGKCSKDGVLIQEMPNEGSVIADILQGKPRPPLPFGMVSKEACKVLPKPTTIATSVRASVANFLQNMKRHAHTINTIANVAAPVSTNDFSRTLHTTYTTNNTTNVVVPVSFNASSPVSVNGYGPFAQTIKHIANVATSTTNGRSQVSKNTAETVPCVVSASSKLNAPMLVKTPQGLRYLVPQSTATPLAPKPDVTHAGKAALTTVTPMVVTVKSDGSLQSIVALQPPTQTNVTSSTSQLTTHNKANVSLLSGGCSLLPWQTHGNPTVTAKTLPSSTGQIPTVVPQTMQCLPSKSGATVTQKWSPAQTIIRLPQTTVQSSAASFTSNSPVVMRYPLIPVPKSVVAASQGLSKVATPVVSATSLLKPTSVTLNANMVSQCSPTNTTQVGLQDTKTVKTNDADNATEKAKFYLLKIDGKNVLIPVDGCQFQPKAYVVNNDVASKLSTSTSSTTTCSSISSTPVLQKPTLAVEPSVKVHLNLPPPIKIKQEPMDDWSEHLMKTTVSAPSSTSLSNISNYSHRIEPKTNIIMEKQHMQNIRGHASVNQLVPTQSNSKEQTVSSAAVGISVQRNGVTATSTGIGIRHSSTGDGVDSKTSPISNNEDKAKHEAIEEKKPVAFTEALTAREERLRKLKELRKEKQMAVEAIRSIKTENE